MRQLGRREGHDSIRSVRAFLPHRRGCPRPSRRADLRLSPAFGCAASHSPSATATPRIGGRKPVPSTASRKRSALSSSRGYLAAANARSSELPALSASRRSAAVQRRSRVALYIGGAAQQQHSDIAACFGQDARRSQIRHPHCCLCRRAQRCASSARRAEVPGAQIAPPPRRRSPSAKSTGCHTPPSSRHRRRASPPLSRFSC